MQVAKLLIAYVAISTVGSQLAFAGLIHDWDFTSEANGTVLSSVADSVAGIHFSSELDSQAIVNNGALEYTPSIGTFFASASIAAGKSEYRWTVDFESFVAVEDAVGDGRRMHFGLYSSTQDILSNVHPTSSVAQVRMLSTNPPSNNLLVRRFTVLGDSAAFLPSSLDDFQLSFLLKETSYEVSVVDDGTSTVLFSGTDTRPEDIASVNHFILSGEAFNGGNVSARIKRITIDALDTVQPIPEPTSFAIFGLGAFGIVASGFRRRRMTT